MPVGDNVFATTRPAPQAAWEQRYPQWIASLPPCGHQHSHFAIRTGAAAQLSRLFSGFRRLPVSQLQVVQLLPLCDSSQQNCFTCVL